MIDTSLFSRRLADTALDEILEQEDDSVHGYTPASGLPALRGALADALNLYDLNLSPEKIYVTCGAQAGRAILAHALLEPGDEILFLYPPKVDLLSTAKALGAKVVENGVLSARTRLVVLSHADPVPDGLAEMLRTAEQRCGHPIYLLADGLVPSPATEALLQDYDSVVLNEDFGEDLAGECIGFLAVSGKAAEADELYAAITGAARACGYVNPPSLMQRAVGACLG